MTFQGAAYQREERAADSSRRGCYASTVQNLHLEVTLVSGNNTMIPQEIYWDISVPLSYNALFNFIIGNRGGGKSYGVKKHIISRFIKRKEQWVYVRRYKTEFVDDGDNSLATFFDDIREEFPGHELEVKGKKFFIDGECAGFAMALSTAKTKKSVPRPGVQTIFFDEFIIDKGVYHYLPDEVTNFLELYETIARMRDVQVWFVANAITVTNPYFLYFHISLPYGKTIYCKNDKLIELVQKAEFIETKKKTRFARMIEGTDYARYAIENDFLRDNPVFIEKKTGQCNYMFSIAFAGVTMGVWANWSKGLIYISKDHDPDFPLTFALSKDDHTPNTMLISSLRQNRHFKWFIENFNLGNVRFENMNLKNTIYDIMRAVTR